MPEHQAILGAAGEHAVRLVDAAGDQVVDQDADIGPRAVEDQRRLALDRERGVDAGDQALGRRLLVAGRAVDLAGEEEVARPAWSRASGRSWIGGAKSYSTA